MYRPEAEDLFGHAGKPAGAGSQLVFHCPECDPNCGKERKLYVGLESGGFFCQRCQYCGWVDTESLPTPKPGSGPQLQPFSNYRPIPLTQDTRAYDYLLKRGIPRDLADDYGLVLSNLTRYDGLILIPVHDDGYKGWQGRLYLDLDDIEEYRDLDPWLRPIVHAISDPRWVSCKGFRRATCMWNWDRAQHADTLVMVEGIQSAFSALREIRYRPKTTGWGCAATLGKAVTRSQLSKVIKARPKRVIVCLDPDAMWQASLVGALLKGYRIEVLIVELPAETDLGDIADPWDRLQGAVPFSYIDMAKYCLAAEERPKPIRGYLG